MNSIRQRLMLGIGAAALITFLGAGIAIYFWARASLISEFDAATLATARSIASAVELHDGRATLEDVDQTLMHDFQRAENPEYFEVLDETERILIKSPSLAKKELKPPSDIKQLFTAAAVLPDGRVGRQLVMPFDVHLDEDEQSRTPQKAVLIMDRETASLDRILMRLRWLLLVVSAAAIAAMLLFTAMVVRHGLQPLASVATQIRQIGAANLSDRVAGAAMPEELAPIVLRLNDLLGRLQSAFDREKSFTADAAHELRTPLAGLESALEVCARRERAPEAYAAVISDCLSVVRGMHGMIDNLLALARVDANQIVASREPTQLNGLLEETWVRFKPLAEERSVSVKWDVLPDLVIHTDREKLSHVFSNLFDNAIRYVNWNGEIRVQAISKGNAASIVVSNSGSRLPPEDAAYVFERFWRGDPARTDGGTNCGLGLSVCRKMIQLLDGSIHATSKVGGEFSVEIMLPKK